MTEPSVVARRPTWMEVQESNSSGQGCDATRGASAAAAARAATNSQAMRKAGILRPGRFIRFSFRFGMDPDYAQPGAGVSTARPIREIGDARQFEPIGAVTPMARRRRFG